MRTCPNCQREWPDQANFCPMDGAILHAEKAPPPRSRAAAPRASARPVGQATRVVQEATRQALPRDPVLPVAPVPPAPGAEPSGSPRHAAAAGPDAPTMITASPLAGPSASASVSVPPATTAPAPGKLTRTSKRAAAPAVTAAEASPDVTPTVTAMPAVPAIHQADTAELPGDTPAQSKHFSETAWFMAAADLESMEVLDDDVDVAAMEERYLREGRNPTEIRQRFSLTITEAPEGLKEALEEIRAKAPKKTRK